MSIHDRAAVRAVPKYTLTVSRYLDGCSQTVEFSGLSLDEVEAEKAVQRECYANHELSFDVERY
jgi:hypothetical protein